MALRITVPPDVIVEMVARYAAGNSTDTISDDLGIGVSVVRRTLREEGVTLRDPRQLGFGKRAVARERRGPRLSPEEVARLRRAVGLPPIPSP